VGIADQLRDAMVRDGLGRDAATRQIWCADRKALRPDRIAGDGGECQTHHAAQVDRPIILPLSNPTERLEAMLDQLIARTDGRG
jgi:malate dehydrogenase (oxaloacetate-decarboxylating)